MHAETTTAQRVHAPGCGQPYRQSVPPDYALAVCECFHGVGLSEPEPRPDHNGAPRLQPGIRSAGLAGRVLLGERVEDGAEPPPQLVVDLLYEGRIHSLSSEPGDGKTLTALWAALEVARQGRPILYFDAENGPALISERLADMRADPVELDLDFHYHASPEITLEAASLSALRTTIASVKPVLVVFDSLPDFLALAGLNENDASDVTRWVRAVAQPIRDAGGAILLLDHLTKSTEGRGRYARGSGAKLAKADVAWSLAQTKRFDRERVGEITLTLSKDREAYLPARQRFAVGGSDSGLMFRPASGVIEEPDADGLTESARHALEVLEDAHRDDAGIAAGVTFGQWCQATGMARSTFGDAKLFLERTGKVSKNGKRYFPIFEDSPNSPAGLSSDGLGSHINSPSESGPPLGAGRPGLVAGPQPPDHRGGLHEL